MRQNAIEQYESRCNKIGQIALSQIHKLPYFQLHIHTKAAPGGNKILLIPTSFDIPPIFDYRVSELCSAL